MNQPKSELIYGGKYYTIGAFGYCQLIKKEQLSQDAPPNLLGIVISFTPCGDGMFQPSAKIPVLEGEGCPIEGFPEASIYTGSEIPF